MTGAGIRDVAARLVRLGERQHRTLEAAFAVIADVLAAQAVNFRVEPIATVTPAWRDSVLRVNGRLVPAKPTGLVSGTVTGKDSLVSSLIGSRFLLDQPNLNFNPRNLQNTSISAGNFYFAPSFAVGTSTVRKILAAKTVSGTLAVRKQRGTAKQILIGNLRAPRRIVFTHYDSIGPGAIDNASGVATVFGTIARFPTVLDSSLFVIDPNEELSYDRPTYWGHGYREFERRHGRLLSGCERVYSVDCVGNGRPTVAQDPRITYLALPLKRSREWERKTFHVFGDIDQLMTVYHSDADTTAQLSAKRLEQTTDLLVRALSDKIRSRQSAP